MRYQKFFGFFRSRINNISIEWHLRYSRVMFISDGVLNYVVYNNDVRLNREQERERVLCLYELKTRKKRNVRV